MCTKHVTAVVDYVESRQDSRQQTRRYESKKAKVPTMMDLYMKSHQDCQMDSINGLEHCSMLPMAPFQIR